MAERKLLFLITLSLTFLISFCYGVPFRQVLGKENYAIIGVRNCSTSTQIFVDDNICIAQMTDNIGLLPGSHNSCPPYISLLYAPMEHDSIAPPQIMTVFENGNQLVYNLLQIEYPGFNSTVASMPLPFERFSMFNPQFNHTIADTVGIVYDHTSRFLYIIFRNFEDSIYKLKAVVYLMEPDETKRDGLRNKYLYQFDVHDYYHNTEWSSDIYSQKFYYHKQEYSIEHGRSVSKLFSVPYGSLTYYLQHGLQGNPEKDFIMQPQSQLRKNVQVTNGMIYSTVQGNDRVRFLGSLHQIVGGLSCTADGRRPQDFLFVLTGWELCKLRDGPNSDRDTCEIPTVEREDSTDESTSEQPTKSSSSGFLWAITSAIILNAIILLIILCVLCKRKEVDKFDNMYPADKDPNGALLTPEEIFRRRRTTSTLTEF